MQAGAGDGGGGGEEALPYLRLIGLRRHGGAPEKTPLLWLVVSVGVSLKETAHRSLL